MKFRLHREVRRAVQLGRGRGVDDDRLQLLVAQRGGEEGLERILIQLHQLGGDVPDLRRQIVLARHLKRPARLPRLLQTTGALADVHRVAMRRHVEIDGGDKSIKAVRLKHAGKTIKVQLARHAAVQHGIVRLLRRGVFLHHAARELHRARAHAQARRADQRRHFRERRFQVHLHVRVLRLRVVLHRAIREQRTPSAVQQFRAEALQIHRAEIRHRAARGERDVRVLDPVAPRSRRQLTQLRGQVQRKFLPRLLRNELKVHAQLAAREVHVRAGKRAPVRQIKIRDHEVEGRLVHCTGGFAQFEPHRFRQRAAQELRTALPSAKRESLHQRGLVRLI